MAKLYASPGVSDARYLASVVVKKASTLVRKHEGKLSRVLFGLSARLARPRCVYPRCRAEVANWFTGEYFPIDSDLCEEHHDNYTSTSAVFNEHLGPHGGDMTDAEYFRRWCWWHRTQENS